MNKHVLALSTALSILAFTPAFAQNNTATVDCTQEANKTNPACMNKQDNNTNATGQTQTQGQSNSGTTTTDQNAQSGSNATTTDQNAQSGSSTTTTTKTTDQTTTQSSGTQMSTGELIVPADRLNSAQMMSANDYIGKTVYDQAGNNIGDVNDLIISQDGQIQAVILGVGGFLGIGEKDVAVNTNAIQMVQDGDNTRLVVQTTKEALNSAPSYDKKNRRYATESTGTTTETTGSTTAPAAPATTNDTTGNTSGSATVDCTKPENASNAACANKTQQSQ